MKIIMRSKGFTLIELMVTIAVLAIIAMMAVPVFGDMVESQQLNSSTQKLITQLNNARSKAVLERRSVEVRLNSTAADTAARLNWSPEGNAILKASSPTTITFQLNGGVRDFAANIQDKPFVICNKSGGDKSKNISISLMGTLQVTEGDCS